MNQLLIPVVTSPCFGALIATQEENRILASLITPSKLNFSWTLLSLEDITRAKVAQTFGSGRIIVLSKSLMKRLESSLLEQINYEKVRKLFT